MIRRLYNWTMNLAGHPKADRWLAFIAFIESSLFPIPPDAMLVPMALANRGKALRYALICTVASVLGGLLGYAIGYYLWEAFGQPLFAFYGYMEAFDAFRENYIEWGAWLVFVFGLTFFPFKVITIASGVVALDPLIFIVAMIASRAPRFYIECLLIRRFGERIRRFIEKRLTMLVSLAVMFGVLGFVALKYIG
jgi:membrane protein YqaA with SNARE-associated domain